MSFLDYCSDYFDAWKYLMFYNRNKRSALFTFTHNKCFVDKYKDIEDWFIGRYLKIDLIDDFHNYIMKKSLEKRNNDVFGKVYCLENDGVYKIGLTK